MSPLKSLISKIFYFSSSLFYSKSNYQLYDNWSLKPAWSEVSTVITSVEKSGPNMILRVLITPGLLGFPPDKAVTVNYSSGFNNINYGPKTILLVFFL